MSRRRASVTTARSPSSSRTTTSTERRTRTCNRSAFISGDDFLVAPSREPNVLPQTDVVSDSRSALVRSWFQQLDRSPVLSVVLALAFPILTIQIGDLLSTTQLRRILEWPLYRYSWMASEEIAISSPVVG